MLPIICAAGQVLGFRKMLLVFNNLTEAPGPALSIQTYFCNPLAKAAQTLLH
ncbi:hypothetical protein [Leptospira interrogans]|uniref:hypothetical protein n=1 Tax=Leptospira interrogans TaxID=173 RepID=UPI001EEFC15E|nr:hypothetical protein [Leptospira interrogans]ULG81231.1 hypothetical protein FH595_04255 [Leptospira interrogans]